MFSIGMPSCSEWSEARMYPPPGAAMSIASLASAITSSGVPNGRVRDESMLPMRPKRLP